MQDPCTVSWAPDGLRSHALTTQLEVRVRAHVTRDRQDQGFTLVEIVIAIVLVGVLSAVVVVGVGSLVETGSAASCTASADAAKAAAAAFWSGNAAYPDTVTDLAAGGFLELPDGAVISGDGLTVTTPDWILTMAATAGAPRFACSAAGGRSPGRTSADGTPACPGSYSGWVGEYYASITPTGTPTVCRDDSAVNFDWATGSPDASIASDNYSVRWTRTVSFTAGNHTFTVGSDDGHRLFLDGTLVLDTWRDQAYTTSSTTQHLTAGTHEVVVEYYERGGYARATLIWT